MGTVGCILSLWVDAIVYKLNVHLGYYWHGWDFHWTVNIERSYRPKNLWHYQTSPYWFRFHCFHISNMYLQSIGFTIMCVFLKHLKFVLLVPTLKTYNLYSRKTSQSSLLLLFQMNSRKPIKQRVFYGRFYVFSH